MKEHDYKTFGNITIYSPMCPPGSPCKECSELSTYFDARVVFNILSNLDYCVDLQFT